MVLCRAFLCNGFYLIFRWRDVKLRAFDNAKHRTYVDLKVSVFANVVSFEFLPY